MLGADELGDDDDEERQRHAEPEPGQDVRQRGRQNDAREEPDAARAEALGRPQEDRVDLTHAGDGGEEDREKRRVSDEPDLGGLADPDPYDEHRQHRQRRDGPEQLDQRLDDVADRCEMPGRQAESHAEDGAGAEAQRDTLERRREVDPELAPNRHVEHVAEHEPGTGQEDRVEELQHHHSAREQAPERQERGDGAEA